VPAPGREPRVKVHHRALAQGQHRQRIELAAGLAEGRCRDALQPLSIAQQVRKLIELVLKRAFAQIQRHRHQRRQQQCALTGERLRIEPRTGGELIGMKILF
jgi:hypothetical protein